MDGYVEAHSDLYDAFKCHRWKMTNDEIDENDGAICHVCGDWIEGIYDIDSACLCKSCENEQSRDDEDENRRFKQAQIDSINYVNSHVFGNRK